MVDRRRDLKEVAKAFGVRVADTPVCDGHCAPLDFLESWCFDRPSVAAVLGPRGGGKSFLAAFATFWDSVSLKRHGTKILGGSLAQSQQIYDALDGISATEHGERRFKSITKEAARFKNGSTVSMLAASPKSVRGPHVPTLRLDEIDEIDPEIREAAMGMCMAKDGVPASVTMTSTWHKIGGPMAGLIDRARGGEFPFFSFCAFEVLERCPDERSGVHLENCPACPLVKWCHDTNGKPPKAKRSNGHYAIESLIQKVRTVSLRAFEADYLCLGPKADGLWFSADFEPGKHDDIAEYDPALPVHLALDTGVFTGAVFYQVRVNPLTGLRTYTVFADYLAENVPAGENARALLLLAESLCNGLIDYRWTDPAGGARNPVGPTVMGEYDRAGLPLDKWPRSSVADSLAIVEACLESADGTKRLFVHGRCTNLINAFRSYRRAKRGKPAQWMDYPEDPQHPHEDVMDALRGGLVAEERGHASWGGDPYG